MDAIGLLGRLVTRETLAAASDEHRRTLLEAFTLPDGGTAAVQAEGSAVLTRTAEVELSDSVVEAVETQIAGRRAGVGTARPTAAPAKVRERAGWARWTLVDWLRSRGPAALARLLTLRPDLADPPPADLGALTGRLLDPSSLERAVGDLGAMGLQVLEAVHLLDDGATIAQLVSIGGETATTAQVEAAVAELRDRALVLADGRWWCPSAGSGCRCRPVSGRRWTRC